jgi:serine phosphatase RsbU (regulator of sigma subunit)
VFVALFVGIYEPASGRLEYCNAGQPDALVVRADGAERLHTGGPAPGAVPGSESARYAASECILAPGDTLLVATDGVAGDEGIAARMENLARRLADVEQLAEAVLGLGDSRDDRAVLVLRRDADSAVAADSVGA